MKKRPWEDKRSEESRRKFENAMERNRMKAVEQEEKLSGEGAVDLKTAREHIMANYPNDPLLRHLVITALEQLPKVDSVEVVHGRNLAEDTPSRFECSVCGWTDLGHIHRESDVYNYCPGCGAKMDGERKG